MSENTLTREERELASILKTRKHPIPEMTRSGIIIIVLIANKSGNVDKVLEFCKANPEADLDDIFTFMCTELPINWDEINDDSDDEDEE